VKGLLGMALAGFTKGKASFASRKRHPHEQIGNLEEYYSGRLSPRQIAALRRRAEHDNTSFHDELMNACGWPEIECDGQLLVSHQDVLLMGGKVQATRGYADHVVFIAPGLCESCEAKTCIDMCSGQAITRGETGVPAFDREKCIHCGACLWNCSTSIDGVKSNIEFRAGAGGLHSAEN
jgi:electron-transferring-flavoprotein dehydrogenase